MKHKLLSPRCAILTVLAALTCAVTPSQAQNKKPNILFIMGDDIGWMQPSCYHRGLIVGETPNIDRHRQRRRDLHDLLRRAELHRRAQRLLHRHASAAHRHDPAAVAGQSILPAARHPGHRPVPVRSWLHAPASSARTIWATIRGPADGARLPGVLGLPLPPGRHAASEFPGHQQDAHRAGHLPPCMNDADSWHPANPRARLIPKTALA